MACELVSLAPPACVELGVFLVTLGDAEGGAFAGTAANFDPILGEAVSEKRYIDISHTVDLQGMHTHTHTRTHNCLH